MYNIVKFCNPKVNDDIFINFYLNRVLNLVDGSFLSPKVDDDRIRNLYTGC